MIEMNCPNCGHLLRIEDQYAGQRGVCRACKAPVQAPMPPTAIRPAAPPGDLPVGNVAPESFGAYGKAGDARWEDPTEQVSWKADENEIPAEVLAKNRLLRRKRRNLIVGACAGGIVVLGLILIPILGLRGGTDSEAVIPAPAVAAPPSPAVPPLNLPKRMPAAPRAAVEATAALGDVRVYAVASDPHYHLSECAKYRDGTGQRFQGSVADAVGAGYIPCPECRPPAPGGVLPAPLESAAPPPAVSSP